MTDLESLAEKLNHLEALLEIERITKPYASIADKGCITYAEGLELSLREAHRLAVRGLYAGNGKTSVPQG